MILEEKGDCTVGLAELKGDAGGDRQRPHERDAEDERAEDEAGTGDERGVRALLAARGERDDADETEQAGHERRDRPGAVVGGDGAPLRDEGVGEREYEEGRETGDDTGSRGGTHVVHVPESERATLNRAEKRKPQVAGPARGGMVGLGSAAQKLQKIADMADDLYSKLNEVRNQIQEMRETLENTEETVAALERRVEEQNALIEALARDQGVDVERVLAEAAIEEAEGDGADEGSEASASPEAGDDTDDHAAE